MYDPEVCFEVYNQKLSCPLGSFGSKSLLLLLDGRMEHIACHLFYLLIKIKVLNIFAKIHIKHGQKQ